MTGTETEQRQMPGRELNDGASAFRVGDDRPDGWL